MIKNPRHIALIFTAQGELDPSTATGRLMIGMFSMLAEFEIDLKAERAAAAREAAAARGQHTGRPRKLTAPETARARELKAQGMTRNRNRKSPWMLSR
ncbi:recombinase family protein [Rhodococcus hoagii]|nr:recombinase family protein [Prescottella equi]